MQGAGGNAVLFTRARRDTLRQTGGGQLRVGREIGEREREEGRVGGRGRSKKRSQRETEKGGRKGRERKEGRD